MKFLLQVFTLARIEGQFIASHPKLIWSAAVAVFIPALYVIIYLSSVWDPTSKTGSMPVALINMDLGMTYNGHFFNVGSEIINELKAVGKFGYNDYRDEQEARRLVREGKLAFALIIPANLSANAIPGVKAGAAKPVVFASEGNNYESATIATHFAETLGHQINEKLNERRWEMTFASLNDAQVSLDRLREGVKKLNQGAKLLNKGALQTASGAQAIADGSNLLSGGVGQLTDTIRKTEVGLKSTNARLPSNTLLNRQTDPKSLAQRVLTTKTTLQNIAEKLPEESLLDKMDDGSGQLAVGSTDLSDATKKLAKGSRELALGIEQLASSLPKQIQKPDGSPQGLAHSVEPQVEITAAVKNSGSAFAANVIPGALWLGAGIAAFLIHIRVLPHQAQPFSRPAQLIGKIFFPTLLVLFQGLFVLITARYILDIYIINLGAFALTLAIASTTFLLIVFALTRAFGDAGKAMAMFLLAVQLSSSGGILPIELSGGFFMDISPWLPLTWVVKAIKATTFGAYDGAYLNALLLVGLAALCSAIMACIIGSWRFVHPSNARPAVEF